MQILFFFNWKIVALQWVFFFFFFFAVQQSESAIYIHIPPLFRISFPFRSPQSIACSSLYCTIGSYQLSILYIVVYICQSQSPNFYHPSIPHWCSYVCSLCLHLYFCFANRFICTIFFRSHIYALIYNTWFSHSDFLHSF